MNNDKKSVLKIRCSDGLTSKPKALKEQQAHVHEVRLPGGVLFPDLCAAHFRKKVVAKLLRAVLKFGIQKMVEIKQPSEIILMAHDPCGTALLLRMSKKKVLEAHLKWKEILQAKYPHILVTVIFEEHSSCGSERKPHVCIHHHEDMEEEEEVEIAA